MDKKRVLLVGGLAHNIPDELRESVEIVTHIQQTARKFSTLAQVDYALVITDYASHNLVEAVKAQCDAPIVYLSKGWPLMREELLRRSILPPDAPSGETVVEAPETAGAKTAAVGQESRGTASGLSENELWKTYKSKFIEAVKGALKPGEIIDEAVLLEVLSMSGVPEEDCALILPRLQMAGLVDSPREGVWRSLLGRDGFEYRDASEAAQKAKSGLKQSGEASHQEAVARHRESARKLAGLPRGPYRSKKAIIQKLLEYDEWSKAGEWLRKKIVVAACELGIIDETQTEIYIKSDPKLVLRKLTADAPTEPVALALSPVSPFEQMKLNQELRRTADEASARRRWPEVVAEVGKRNKTIGAILGNSAVSWIDEKKIMACLIPAEFSMYRQKLESTEVWGMVSQVAREILGPGVAVRFMVDNIR